MFSFAASASGSDRDPTGIVMVVTSPSTSYTVSVIVSPSLPHITVLPSKVKVPDSTPVSANSCSVVCFDVMKKVTHCYARRKNIFLHQFQA